MIYTVVCLALGTLQNPKPTNNNLASVYFIDATTGFMVGEDYDMEQITFFSSETDFQEAWAQNEKSFIEGQILHRVISFKHLVQSKLKSQRPKDLLDVQELIRVRET